jgi:hypothetical protein
MSLLREIQDAAVDGSSDLETLLRKCRVLATRLKHDQLKSWVGWELDGYPQDVELPEYRKFHCQCFGHFTGYGGSQVRNAPIPETCIPKEIRRGLTHAEMRQGIGPLKQLVDTAESGTLMLKWPAETSHLFGGNIFEYYALAQGWMTLASSAIVGILSTVRNRILSFALEIEASYPDAGEAAPGETPVPKEIVTQIFNQTFNAPVANVASGHAIEQTGTINIQQGDFRTLATFLHEKGVSKEDIQDLEVAIKSDPQPTGKAFGKKVAGWMGKMVAKSAEGAWKVTTDVATKLLVEAIKTHYGMPH